MPTYEYHCSKCDGNFDIYQSIASEPLTVCPQEKCCQKKWGKGKVKRAIGAGAGLIFKGSGFYITDYRSENYKAAAKKDSSGPSTTPASTSSTSTSSSSGSEKKSSGGESKSSKSSGSGSKS